MEEIEKARKKALMRVVISFGITSIITVPIVFALKQHFFPNVNPKGAGFFIDVFIPIVFSIVIIVLITRVTSMNEIDKFKQLYLKDFIKIEFDKHFKSVTVSRSGLSRSDVIGANLIRNGNKYSSNDLIQGVYRGIRFSKADVLMQEETTDSDGNTNTTTYFKGQWIRLQDLDKKVTQVQLANKKLLISSKKGFEKVETESIDFNKVFKIYAKKSHDVFYILTPHIISNFLLYPKNKGFGVSVQGNTAHLAIDTGRDSLEARLTRPINTHDYEAIRLDIDRIQSTIDLLLEQDENERYGE